MKQIFLIKTMILIPLILGYVGAHARSSDADQPIEIEADFAELDDRVRKAVYTGNVVVTQGSIRMTGDRFIIHYTPDNELQKAFMKGKPARFKQRPDNADEDVEGEAIQFEYFATKNMMHLIENAKVTQGAKHYSGYYLTYDTVRSITTARRAKSGEQTPSGAAPPQRERIVVIMPPKKKKTAPACKPPAKCEQPAQ